MEPEKKIILPGADGFNEAFADIKQDLGTSPIEIQFDKLSFPKTESYVEFATVDVDDLLVNLTFHFKKMTTSQMESMGHALRAAVEGISVPGLSAAAQVNDRFSKQWDFFLMKIPRSQGPSIKNHILNIIKDTFSLIS